MIASEWASQTDWRCPMNCNSIVHAAVRIEHEDPVLSSDSGIGSEKTTSHIDITFTFAIHLWFKIHPGYSSELQYILGSSKQNTMTQSFVSVPATMPSTGNIMTFIMLYIYIISFETSIRIIYGVLSPNLLDPNLQPCNISSVLFQGVRCQASHSFGKKVGIFRQPYWLHGY